VTKARGMASSTRIFVGEPLDAAARDLVLRAAIRRDPVSDSVNHHRKLLAGSRRVFAANSNISRVGPHRCSSGRQGARSLWNNGRAG